MQHPSFAGLVLPAVLSATIAMAEEVGVPVLDWDGCPAAAEGMASTDGMLGTFATVPMD